MADEDEGMELERVEDTPNQFIDDTMMYKQARLQAAEILELRCKEQPDAVNVLARVEAAIRATAHYGQEDSAMLEAAEGVGWRAFLDHSAMKTSPRRTRP